VNSLESVLKADQKRTEDANEVSNTLIIKGLMVFYSRSAKPLCVGSIPTRASNLSNNLQDMYVSLIANFGRFVGSLARFPAESPFRHALLSGPPSAMTLYCPYG